MYQIDIRKRGTRRQWAIIEWTVCKWRATVDEDRYYSFALPLLMPQPGTRSNRQVCDAPRSCTTPRGLSDIAG
jgi:hypothetical protein